MDGMRAKEKLYHAACDLFVEKGFKGTTVRDIANQAGVNSGLWHYYYKSKRNIAFDIMEKMFHAVIKIASAADYRGASSALLHGIRMRLNLYFLYSEANAKFYTDCLKEDIFEEVAIPKCTEIIGVINREFGSQHTHQDLMLVQSIAINAQRTMILKRQEGLIDYSLETMAALEYKLFLSFFSLEPDEIVRLNRECSYITDSLVSDNTRLTDIRNLT
jgi:AcrR family transcriptional regulator